MGFWKKAAILGTNPGPARYLLGTMRIFLLLLFLPSLLPAASQDVVSQISAVTVYADRARVTRAAEVQVPGGESVLRFVGLPSELEESSVQAGGLSEGGLTILGLEIRDAFLEETANPQVRELERQLRELNDQEADLARQRKDLEERRVFLFKMRDGLAVRNKEGQTDLAQIKTLYEFYGAELDGLGKQTLASDVASRELQPKKRVVEEELARLKEAGAKEQKEVLVAVRAQNATGAKLSLSYNMSDAGWQPLYDARVNSKDGKIDLAYYGTVRQETGENWDNVKLLLSTARPSVGASMPDLQPWWVQMIEMRPMARKRNEGDAYAGIAPASAPVQKPELMRVVVDEETAEIDSAGISTVFEIKIPATIPSDGEPHRVAITTQKFDGKLEYVTTPKLADLAYLKARLTNTSNAPILGGEANLFRDGDFVGLSRFDFTAQGAEFDFYLGVDDGVKVTRKTLLDKTGEGGVFSKSKQVTRKYETTIENFKPGPVTVTLYDQLPVSQDTSIKISGIKFSEPPRTEDKATGKLTWEFSLEPKQKKILTEEFTVEWPADKQVSGL